MKIKFFSNYHQSDTLLRKFNENYDIYDNALSFTINDDYDVAVVFNRTDERLKESSKIITVIQEPSWSPVHLNNSFLTSSDYLIVHDVRSFEDRYHIELGKKVFELPSYMFYYDHVDKSFFLDAGGFAKTKKLSMIVSAQYLNIGNYGKRIELLGKILDSDLDIDIYGRGFSISDRRYKGELVNKHTGLLPYEYSIAIENSNEKNYITEKFVDCVLCNTIPIYSGAPNIAQVYDKTYFHTLDLNSISIIQDIKSIIQTSAPVSGSDTNKKRYFEQQNLYRLLKDIIL